MVNIKRCSKNPLIKPVDVMPSRADFKVDGVFNCGVAKYEDDTILLCRVAESVICENDNEVKIPTVIRNQSTNEDQIEIVCIKKSERPDLDFNDSREVKKMTAKGLKTVYLTSLSHLRIARSKNGIDFVIEDKPFVFPNALEESFGMEDPRITKIDDCYYINYTSVTENGPATSLISTKDFKEYKRHGIIFAPENKDVTIFPEKIDGSYVAFNRPVPCGLGNPEMWIAKSPDLIHWGEQKHFCGISESDSWDNGRIGGGAVPVKTEKGWIKIYHAADANQCYSLGVFLLDLEDPSKVIAKTKSPILKPETDYEKEGFFGNVVFTCGCLLENDNIIIYYGAADDKICRADISLEEIYKLLEK